jgi:ADP-heptose:LPS heptosyltransferase
MGFGDALLAAGQAEKIYRADPSLGPVVLYENAGASVRWNHLWADNPAIYRPGFHTDDPSQLRSFLSGAGHLPYARKDGTRLIFHPTWRARDHRASLYLTPAERDYAAKLTRHLPKFILIEPPARSRKNHNRNWPSKHWHALAAALLRHATNFQIAQLARPDADLIEGVMPIHNRTFRDAAAIVERADLIIVPEGGLAHAAAAVATAAIVLWGGCMDATVLGYPEHFNILDGSPGSPCGNLAPCDHCVRCWDALPVADVLGAAHHYYQQVVSTVITPSVM